MRMLNRTLLLLLAAATMSGAADVSAQTKPPKNKGPVKDPLEKKEPDPVPVTIKFFSSVRGKYFGYDVLIVTGVSPIDGKTVKMGIPNEDMKGKHEPKSELADVFKGLKQGDHVLINPKMYEGQPFVDKAKPYTVAPGEDQPGTYVFKNAFPMEANGVDYVDVLLVKYGQPIEAMLTLVKDKDTKKMSSDPALLDAIARLKEQVEKNKDKKDDAPPIVIEAEIVAGGPKPTITSIDPYKAPEQAKLIKFVAEADVGDGNKGPAVELDQDGKPVTLPLVGKLVGKKWTPDARVVAAAKAAKVGTAVLVRTREVGGKAYLKGIQAAPKEPAAPKGATAKGA